MLLEKLRHFKEYHLDTADPEGLVFRASVRSALACLLSLIAFQLAGDLPLAGWAALAALVIMQVDPVDLLSRRLRFVSIALFLMVALAFIGITLSANAYYFAISVPIVIFSCAYASRFGFRYFNAGCWIALLYVAFGGSLAGHAAATPVALTILVVGLGCLLLMLAVFPDSPLVKMTQNFQRALGKLKQIDHFNQSETRKLDLQFQNLLSLQDKLFNAFAPYKQVFSDSQKQALTEASKMLYRANLMMKALEPLVARLSQYPTYPQTGLSTCHQTTVALIDALIVQLKTQKPLHFDLEQRIAHYRESLQTLRLQALKDPTTSLQDILDYSSCLYHCITLWQALLGLSERFAFLTAGDRK